MRTSRSLVSPLVALAVLLCGTVLFARESTLKGRVVGVHDGDTLTLLTGRNKEVKVRLEGIDAPEIGQAFGTASKQSLSELVFGREVTVRSSGTDDYGRHLGNVYVGDRWANLEQVARGMAWQYVHYNHDPKLRAAEIHARAEHLGLWKDKNPTPPWDYRHHPKKKK